MRHALGLAARGLGQVAPNPAVGCVIVGAGGRIAGRGWTRRGGRPHAETEALKQAGAAARGGTAYVTLEPCAHHGRTPPCAEALIAAGIARVVAAAEDPDPRVSGRGFAMLRQAGIAVERDVLRAEAEALNAGFFLTLREKRPLVTLKLAISADGMVAHVPGGEQWITGAEARAFGHLLRARFDAIAVGIETVLADDPALTCRLPGLEDRSPVRVVMDSRLRLPPDSQLVRTARAVPVIVFTVSDGGEDLRQAGVATIRMPADNNGRPDLRGVLAELARRGLTRLLVEGGAVLEQALFSAGLADRLEIFRAPSVEAKEGRSAPACFSPAALQGNSQFRLVQRRPLGPDMLERWAFEA
jgi:diaminohydroxyphosphoribosylaminopyrimidine deaminase/5-amino-6-(5-phosphoribosylamino)uracil reductase